MKKLLIGVISLLVVGCTPLATLNTTDLLRLAYKTSSVGVAITREHLRNSKNDIASSMDKKIDAERDILMSAGIMDNTIAQNYIDKLIEYRDICVYEHMHGYSTPPIKELKKRYRKELIVLQYQLNDMYDGKIEIKDI